MVLFICKGVEIGPCGLEFLVSLSHTHLLLLIHHVHALDQGGLGLGRLLHHAEVFVQFFKMLGEVTILMSGVCCRHVHPQIQDTVLSRLLLTFLINCCFMLESLIEILLNVLHELSLAAEIPSVPSLVTLTPVQVDLFEPAPIVKELIKELN